MSQSPTFDYLLLGEADRRAITTERLQRLEADHYRLTLEMRLAGVVGANDELTTELQLRLAGLEVQAVALREWLGLKEPYDA